ncbi:MAG: glycoside hydrolase family protein [Armatimonadia bacterium]
MPDLDLASHLKPVARQARFAMPGYHVWCGTICRAALKPFAGSAGIPARTPLSPTHAEEVRYYLLFSRWPTQTAFRGWVTHSEICAASAASPTGPFTFERVILPGAGGDVWDRDVTHNPAVLQVGDLYYLYYMGNRGNGEFWDNRNNQRIGVAVAEHPLGPWQRFDQPLIDVNRHSWDYLIASNPSVCPTPDGRFLMIYKTVSEGELPFGGNVYHAAAFADSPTGPFTRQPDPIFISEGVKFPAEDPCVWWQDDRFYVICKDMQGCFTEHGPGLVLWNSPDGKDWSLARHPFVSPRQITWEDGEVQPVHLLDRPQVYLENGQPTVLSCAVKPDESETETFNVQIPIA